MKKGLVDSDEDSETEEGGEDREGKGSEKGAVSFQHGAEARVDEDAESSEEEEEESDPDEVIMIVVINYNNWGFTLLKC